MEEDYVPSVFAESAPVAGGGGAASTGQRIGSGVVDAVVCAALFYPAGYLLGRMLAQFGVYFLLSFSDLQGAPLAAATALLVVMFGYFTLVEGATGGRTLGKWLMVTAAVRSDGSPITLRDAALRSVCRLIPLEPLSVLAGVPWHDRFSATRVVKHRRWSAPVESRLPESSTNYDVRP